MQLGALGHFVATVELPTIYRKNLRRVVFVYGEVAGRPPADAILDIQFDQQPDGADPRPAAVIRPAEERTWFSPGGRDSWALPVGYSVVWTGEGEWKITLDVFRDLGIAFGAALLLIYSACLPAGRQGFRESGQAGGLTSTIPCVRMHPFAVLLGYLACLRPVSGYHLS